MKTTYYRYRNDDGTLRGLFRTNEGEGGLSAERLSGNRWIFDGAIFKFLVDPDVDSEVAEVSEQDARAVASAVGATL